MGQQGARDYHTQEENKRVVQVLYEAFRAKDVEKVQALLTQDLEWWFHGPPAHQHLMHLLTGSGPGFDFSFIPESIVGFGSIVIAEGHADAQHKEHCESWIHAWTVTNGRVTQVREYMNTSLTVTVLGGGGGGDIASTSEWSGNTLSIWQSTLCDLACVPGLVLAL